MKRIGSFIEKYWSHLFLVGYVIKSQLHVHQSDNVIMVCLSILCGYMIYINSIYNKKTKEDVEQLFEYLSTKIDLLEEIHNNHVVDINSSLNDQLKSMDERVSVNHAQVDKALANITSATNEELTKIKTDMGQINLAQGIGNGRQKDKQIFF